MGYVSTIEELRTVYRPASDGAVRKELGVSEEALPVGHLLPAMRAAGISAAHDRRGDGVPPIRLVGDGVLV